MVSDKEDQRKDAQKPPQNRAPIVEEKKYDKHGNELAALKWPLTRRERIHELDLMLKEYEDTPSQVENIQAARAWHLRFPLDELVQDELVSFQRGKKIEESELRGGLIWCEGAPEEDMMTGHGQATRALQPLGLAANITEKTKCSYYTRASDRTHM